MTELIYCAARNWRFAEIALRYGFRYGAQLPSTVYFPPYFTDQNWRESKFDAYIAALDQHRPALATVLDWERDEQLDEVLTWAETASQFVGEAVIIIPKVTGGIQRLPRSIGGKSVRLGYSVPTRYSGTCVPIWEFHGWPIHLLGGSPQEQIKLARYLDVVSADGNYIQGMATRWNLFFSAGKYPNAKNQRFPQMGESVFGKVEHDVPYLAFELSCLNVKAAWAGCTTPLRFATLEDVDSVQKIGYQWRSEVGRVMRPALMESVVRRSLIVAERNGQIVGFCNFRRRRDGISVIYEIAVHREHLRSRIGTGLLAAVPGPIRLKVTEDNQRAGQFYEAAGLTLIGREPGRQRPLRIYEGFHTSGRI